MTDGLRQFVWDVPTRLFHWLLVALLGFSWWSAENHYMEWHLRSGLTVFALIAFRVFWGVFGTGTARFSQFVKGPRAALAYLRGTGVEGVGHNPVGGWSVVLLLLALAVQTVSGLFSVDVDGIESGPLAYLVDFDQGRVAASIHETSFNLLLALTVLHVAAIFFYLLFRRRNLIGAMITGFQKTGEDGPIEILRTRWWRLLVAIAAAASLSIWVANGGQFTAPL